MSSLFRLPYEKAVLLCDVYEPHINTKELCKDILKAKKFDIVTYPGGCNSKLNPILFGLADKFKVYKFYLL